jgi:hypothetical protein
MRQKEKEREVLIIGSWNPVDSLAKRPTVCALYSVFCCISRVYSNFYRNVFQQIMAVNRVPKHFRHNFVKTPSYSMGRPPIETQTNWLECGPISIFSQPHLPSVEPFKVKNLFFVDINLWQGQYSRCTPPIISRYSRIRENDWAMMKFDPISFKDTCSIEQSYFSIFCHKLVHRHNLLKYVT